MTLTSLRKCQTAGLFILLFGHTASAQVKFGVKTGLTFAEMLAAKSQTANIDNITMNMINFPRTNIHAGVYFDIPLYKQLHLQPEALCNNQGSNSVPRYSYTIGASETYKFNYVNFPLLLKWQFPYHAYIATGPQFGLLLDAKIEQGSQATNKTYHVKDQYKSNDFGWVWGVGYLSPINLGIDIRYNLGFTDINKATAASAATIPVQNGRFRNSGLQLGIFFQFGKNRIQTTSPAPGD